MRISETVVLALAVLLAWAAVYEVRRAWRDPRPSVSPVDRVLLASFGSRVSRGAARAVIARAVILVAVAVLLAADAIAPLLPQGWTAVVRDVGTGVGLAGVILGGTLLAMIGTRNRPRFLVPPSMRSDNWPASVQQAETPDPRYWTGPGSR
jgi:hypothetical protein